MYKVYADLRDKKGVTDYEVSKRTGISTSTLTEWKKHTYTPKIEKIKKLAEYFGVPISVFLDAT